MRNILERWYCSNTKLIDNIIMFTEIPISINPYDMPQKIDYPNVHAREPFCDDNLLEHNIYIVCIRDVYV